MSKTRRAKKPETWEFGDGFRSSCNMKKIFPSYNDALSSAEDYMDQVTLTFAPMQPYWCNRHHVWHIGHDYKGRNQDGDARLRSLHGANGRLLSKML